MENSVKISEVCDIGEKSRSLDLQSLYVEKGEGSGVKRQRQALGASEEFGLEQGKKKKRSRKVVSVSSFESVNNKSKNSLNAVDGLKLEQKDLADDVTLNLDANVVPIPKRPRCFMRRKKLQSNNLSVQGDASEKARYDGQSVELAVQSVTPIQTSECHKKNVGDDSKENRPSRANSAQSLGAKDSASLRNIDIVSKSVRRNRGKRRESRPQEHTGVDWLESSADRFAQPCEKLQEGDEDNLEENAARMLSSRFDPCCTSVSGNGTASASQPGSGLAFASSIRGNFIASRSNHSAGLGSKSVDAAGRVLRPRGKGKRNRHSRKRRHFYEMFSKDVDAYWVIHRRIKVFWPLDQSWYFGHVTSYDPHRKLHHVKYDDRDEEWINLQIERFKLLLLPGEVPHMPNSEKFGLVIRRLAQEKGGAEVEDDNCLDSYLESEPLISWLARSARRVKSSLLGVTKRRKLHSHSKNISTAMLSEASVGTLPGCLVDGAFRADASNLSSNPVIPDESDKEISETRCSNDRMLRFVYFRKGFRQRGQSLGCTSDNSHCRSIVVYDPHIYCIERFMKPKEHDMAHQLFGVDDLDPGCVLWSGENLGLLKLTVSLMNTRKVTLKLGVQLSFSEYTHGTENLWVCRTLFLLQYGMVMVMWPRVQLEMIFVDNVVGLRFLLFEGCLMQAVAFVCSVLVAFHQPNECGKFLDQQIPVTSIRFEISGFPSFGRRFIFTLYNFVEVKNSKWLYLDNKLKQYCSVTKQLPLSECTYDNIKILQSRSSLLPCSSVCGEPVSLEGLRKKSRQSIIHKRITKESAYVNMGLSSSSCNEKPKSVPQFLLPFGAAPTFFMRLHLKLLMSKNVASISFHNPLLLLEGLENCSRLAAGDGSVVEDFPDEITLDNNMEDSLSRTGAVSGLISSESEVDHDAFSMSNEGNSATTSQKCLNGMLNVVETSVDVHDSERGRSNGIVELQKHPCRPLDSEPCAVNSWPPVEDDNPFEDKRDTDLLSHLNGIKVQIPTVNQVESQSRDGELQGAQQSTSDSVWSVNDCAMSSPNPTAPRSVWHRNRHNSGSLSFGYRSKIWPDGRIELSPSGHANGNRKPRSPISYLLPFGNYDFNSKPRSHHRKGRPYKKMRTDSEKKVPSGSGSPHRRLEMLSCGVNVLITVGDRGWRECGAYVVLECVDHNEWRLLVKVSGVIKYSYKAYQFLQPGTTNRYTHVMMWKGGKDWILEFPDRSQWTLFKEMHEECYNRNLRVASIKTIPIPGVRLIEEVEDIGVEVPFVCSSPKYFLQVETDVDMALNLSRVLYDMDSDDEEWISNRRASLDANVSSLMEISEDMFERAMDMFEKVAYTQQREDFTGNEIEELMVAGVPIDLIKDIYAYWKQKRRIKGMPLIRHLQPPLWEKYQQQLKEWELAVNKIHYLPNGCKERAMLLEKPPMFAFCFRPRGLEVPNKGSKQRSHRKVSAGGHSCGFSRDSDGHHASGRKSNGFVYGDERFPTGSNHEYTSSWQTSTRVISPRDAVSTGYLSMSSDGSERSQHRKPHRNKSKKIGTFVSHNDSPMIGTKSFNERLVSKRNGVLNWSVGEWPAQNQYHREGFQRHKVEKLGGPDLDEFRLRDASSAAQHASNMAKLKREKAQRLLYRADVAMHKAMVALMTAEAIKASSEDPTEVE